MLTPDCHLQWTSGYFPGSTGLYARSQGRILFSGSHLLPDRQGHPTPVRTPKTFHWFRQLHHVKTLVAQFTPETLRFICPGANVGYLRGQGVIANAYEQLSRLDYEALQAQLVC